MIARIIAGPAISHLENACGSGVLLGASGSAANIAADGFVIAIRGPQTPLLPNGISVTSNRGAWPPSGARVRLLPGRIEAGSESVVWALGPLETKRSCGPALRGESEIVTWDASVPVARHVSRRSIAARGASVLAAFGLLSGREPRTLAALLAHAGDLHAGRGVTALLRAVSDRDSDLARDAAELMTGRGPGLTPRSDDLLAGAATAVAALGPAVGWAEVPRRLWLGALAPAHLQQRTTPFSATLLTLASAGLSMQPVHDVLNVEAADRSRWPLALQRLRRVGHSTGTAYALAIGASAILMAQ